MANATMLVLAVGAATLAAPAVAGAGVTFGAATRQVTATAGFDPPVSATFSAPGPWSETVYHEYTDDYHLPGSPSWGRARQTSDIGYAGAMAYITGTGTQGGFDGFPVGGVGIGEGENRITVAFTLDVPSQADLFLYALPGAGRDIEFYARVRGPAGILFGRSWSAGEWGPRWAGALLAPGAYTLEAYFRDGWSGASTGGGTGTWSLALTIPAPGAAGPLLLFLLPRRRR